jgi:hypothetical protein
MSFKFSGSTSFSGSGQLAGGGNQFKGTYSIGGGYGGTGRRTFESVVRPFQTIESAPPELPPVRRLRIGEDTEASICAGGPSRFLRENVSEPVRYRDSTSSGIEVIWPDSNDGGTDEPGAIIYQEVSREVSVIRVENPEDAAQYVDVERIEQIDFTNLETGRLVRFILRHDA